MGHTSSTLKLGAGRYHGVDYDYSVPGGMCVNYLNLINEDNTVMSAFFAHTKIMKIRIKLSYVLRGKIRSKKKNYVLKNLNSSSLEVSRYWNGFVYVQQISFRMHS